MEASENLLNVIYADESLEDYHDADMLDSETLEEGECRKKIGSLQLTETSKLTEMGSRGDVTLNQASNNKTRKRRAKKKNKNKKTGPAAAIKNMSKREQTYLVWSAVGIFGVPALSDIVNK
ncbi:hypothetical protein MKW92_018243, partial [Papaver armeniacum]